MRKIAILGSTGSIGRQTLDVAQAHPNHFQVVGLAAARASKLFLDQIKTWHPQVVSVQSEEEAHSLSRELAKAEFPLQDLEIGIGEKGLIQVATTAAAEMVVVAIVGTAALVPTLRAIEYGKQIALANKEVLVAAGQIISEEAKREGVFTFPIDSEHCAIFQCLQGEHIQSVRRLVLTASGGPFRQTAAETLQDVSVEDALNHPNWKMGDKITIDSATLMNKGLEVIEAHWLFNVPIDQIDVVVHPQSIIHSFVEFVDGSVKAQLGTPDMRVPIQYILGYPERLQGDWPALDLVHLKDLTFQKPDLLRFPCLKLAYDAAHLGGTAPAVLNAANEAAVRLFLDKAISFTDIPRLIQSALTAHTPIQTPTLDDILTADQWARTFVQLPTTALK